ncbi:unnamed protein product [Trichobilharzia szidati]|nr:unnamed protein product [Trichobilharzia szidati]
MPNLIYLSVCLAFHLTCVTSSSEQDIAAAKWRFDEFELHISILTFLIAVILIKIAFHYTPYLPEYIPESLLLIIVGIIFGAFIRYALANGSVKIIVWRLTPKYFFLYLLPPIVLESAYGLYNRVFSEYLGTVLLFAVLGTVFNFLLIGFILYGLYAGGAFGYPEITVDLKSFLLFSSLIVAVDPVAVLAIFHDIGLERNLYYIVFGESLLNDAITIVLYEIMVEFTGKKEVTGGQIGIGIASFFTVSLGGLLIGVVFGIVTCLITRIPSHLSTMTVLLLAYFSYIMADCVGWSGIISMIGCGLIQAAYAFHNIDRRSVITIHNFVKVMAELSESVVFVFLGVTVIAETLHWHTGYALWSMVMCLIARGIVVLVLTAILNAVNVDETKISLTEQAILIYGGLRGGVSLCLALQIPNEILGERGAENQNIIVTTTIFIILFTVGFMGTTIKPLVKALKIRMEEEKTLSLFAQLNANILDETLSGIEVIANCKRRNSVREFFVRIDEKYIRRILQRDPERYDEKILKLYEKISLRLHYAKIRPNEMENFLTDLPDAIRYTYMTKGFLPQNDNLGQSSFVGNDILMDDLDEPAEFQKMPKCCKKKTKCHWKCKRKPTPSSPNDLGEDGITNNLKSLKAIKLPRRKKTLLSAAVNNNPSKEESIKNILRYSRRPTLLPYFTREADFNDRFLDILRSRNRELQMRLRGERTEKSMVPSSASDSTTSQESMVIVKPAITIRQMPATSPAPSDEGNTPQTSIRQKVYQRSDLKESEVAEGEGGGGQHNRPPQTIHDLRKYDQR